MKRIFTLLFALAMALSLAACGGSPAEETPNAASTASTTVPSDGPKTVSSVDDFLAAIRPGAEILLTEGTYYLHNAKDYGNASSPYYSWEGWGNGDYSLTLKANDLTIRGCGQGKTNLLTDPRTADVLVFEECQNITLESMSLGHTSEPLPCDGGVVKLSGSTNAVLKDLDLYGCGTVGVSVYQCQDVHVQDCVVHDCSWAGATFTTSQDITVQSTAFRSLGKDEPAEAVFSLYACSNVEISNCDVTENYAGKLLDVNELMRMEESTGSSVAFRNNHVSGNRISEALFAVFDSEFNMDNNLFDDNESRNWYAAGSTHAVDMAGAEVVFEEDIPDSTQITPGVAVPVSTGAQTEVHVSTVDEFLKALNSDTCIILDAELIDLSAASEYSAAEKFMASHDYGATYDGTTDSYYWEFDFDGPGLVIEGLSNLTIMAQGDDYGAHVISATPRYSDVLTFDNCSAITISGFTAGHTKEPGSCAGGVILFRNCENMLVDSCGLFGCGIIGIQAQYSRNLQVINSEIYECSQSGIALNNTENVTIAGTLIRDIRDDYFGEGPFYEFHSSSNITLDGEPLDGNYRGR